MKNFTISFASGVLLSLGAACIASNPESGRNIDNIEEGRIDVERNPDVIDRAGRPEINVFIVRAPEPQLPHNQQDAHAIAPEHKGAFKGLLQAGIAFWDALDGKADWGAEGGAALAETMVHDYLVVDTSRVCSVDDETYFEIERAPIGEHTTCGGRTPNADVIDTLVTMLIGGARSDVAYGDDIDEPTKRSRDTFPYLRGPHVPEDS